MGLIRPATPGFLVTLIATALLAVVSFCVPYFKSVYFLRAGISSPVNGSITFGTLGYCLELPNGTTCSQPSVGYELNINQLVGNNFPVQIPTVVVKWLTYALVLHIVALGLAAGSAVFGLLAHVREMSMTCCSSCISGFAAAVALVAFIFDLALFFIARSRIRAVPGGSAEIGNAIWLTLAAWILLFFSGCFYTLGRCCISKRKNRGGGGNRWTGNKDNEIGNPRQTDQLRLDAVKAEADRKARQKENGLPAFFENKQATYETLPLTARVDGDAVSTEPYRDVAPPPAPAGPRRQGSGYAGGYAQAAAGTRAVDEYYNPSQGYNNTPSTTYPPQPSQQARRQPSTYAPSTYAPSAYTQSTSPPPSNQYSQYGTPHTATPPPLPTTGAQYGQRYGTSSVTSPPANNQYLSAGYQYGQDPFAAAAYGHAAGESSYHSTASHQQYASAYSQGAPEPAFNSETYNASAMMTPATAPYATNLYDSSSYYSPQSTAAVAAPQPQPHERAYTLGGDGYGENSVPPLHDQTAYYPYQGDAYNSPAPQQPAHTSPAPINTNIAGASTSLSPVHRSPENGLPGPSHYEDAPPGYDAGSGQVTGAWGKH